MPTESTEERKLAAIMFTDMVGYSALAQHDDKVALELLEEHRRLLREIFPRFHGTGIKTIRDAFLVEFNSALEAAQCAIEIQRALAKRNADVPPDRRIEVKCRGNGFRELYRWLDGADFLIVRADRARPLVIVPFHLAIEIAKAAENSRTCVK